MAKNKKFCTAINCMDGRTQLPINEYLRRKFNIDYVDTITEPGPIKYLSDDKDKVKIKSIFDRIDISVFKHGSQVIAVVGHHDCAGNPLNKMEQIQQINRSIYLLKLKYKECKIIGLYVNEIWEVEEI